MYLIFCPPQGRHGSGRCVCGWPTRGPTPEEVVAAFRPALGARLFDLGEILFGNAFGKDRRMGRSLCRHRSSAEDTVVREVGRLDPPHAVCDSVPAGRGHVREEYPSFIRDREGSIWPWPCSFRSAPLWVRGSQSRTPSGSRSGDSRADTWARAGPAPFGQFSVVTPLTAQTCRKLSGIAAPRFTIDSPRSTFTSSCPHS